MLDDGIFFVKLIRRIMLYEMYLEVGNVVNLCGVVEWMGVRNEMDE